MAITNNIGARSSDAAEYVSTPDLKPESQSSLASTPAEIDQPLQIPDLAATADKRMEEALDAAYFKGELGKTPNGPGVSVLYDKAQDRAAGTGETKVAAPPQVSKFTSMRLGWDQDGNEIRTRREVGSPQGYDNRLEATAVARLNGADPAAIVQGLDGRWHALESTANLSAGWFAAADTPTRQLYGLPSSNAFPDQLNKVKSLEARLEELNKNTHPGKAEQQERDKVIEDLKQGRRQLAALEFGVPESDINMDPEHPAAGKINLVPPGTIRGNGETDMDPKTGTIVTKISTDMIGKPVQAMVTLYHEGTHVKDDELALEWHKNYDHEPHGKQSFEDWIKEQAAHGRISKSDEETVRDIWDYRSTGGNVASEAHAHVRSALTAIEAGHPDEGKNQLLDYAGNNLDSRSDLKDVKVELEREIQTAYRQMSPAMQQQLKNAMEAANKARPGTWISQVKL